MKRAVLYARVSSDDTRKDGRNLTGQLEMGREYAEKRGYTVVAELAEDDRGASGADIDLPQLNCAREMARRGEFDVLVVREIDRLSRNLAKQLIVEEELKRAGVMIEYVLGEYPNTPEGDLMKHVRASVAEYEREKIKERTSRARRRKTELGSVMPHGRPPYGYTIVHDDRGMWSFAIVPDQAEVVRNIFHWYVEGDGENGPLSLGAIVRKLDELRVPTWVDACGLPVPKRREPGQWSKGTLYELLTNETYAGVWHYGKGRGEQRRDREHQIAVDVSVIIERPLWERVQAKRKESRDHRRKESEHSYLMTGRLTCGNCGYHLASNPQRSKGGKTYFRYLCPVYHNRYVVHCEEPMGHNADVVDAVAWEWVKSFLLDPEKLATGLANYERAQEQQCEPYRRQLSILENKLGAARSKRAKLLDAWLEGEFEKEELAARKQQLETIITSFEEERGRLLAYLAKNALTEDQVATLTGFAQTVREGLDEAETNFAQRRWIIQTLDVNAKIVIDNGEKVLLIQSVLGRDPERIRLLSLCSETRASRTRQAPARTPTA